MTLGTVILTPGGPFTHVTIDDQSGNPLPPNEVSWSMPSALQGLLTITADGTGFELLAAPGASAPATNVTFTFNGGGGTATINVSVQIGEAVVSLGATSP